MGKTWYWAGVISKLGICWDPHLKIEFQKMFFINKTRLPNKVAKTNIEFD